MDTNGKGCGSCKGGACGEGSCGTGKSCGGCCGNKAVHIIVKLALIALIFWAGTEFGERKALTEQAGYAPMMGQYR